MQKPPALLTVLALEAKLGENTEVEAGEGGRKDISDTGISICKDPGASEHCILKV